MCTNCGVKTVVVSILTILLNSTCTLWPTWYCPLTCETNGRCDVSVSVGASPLDTTTILNGTVSHTYLQHVWVSSSREVCHYCLTSQLSCQIQGSILMEVKQQI